MKVTYLTLLTLTIGQALAESSNQFVLDTSTPKSQIILQDRPFAIEYVMSELVRVHKEVFQLPFSSDYISETLMVEIKAQRNIIAPNYPGIELNDTNQELVYENFTAWYAAHQQEFTDYLQYVEQFIADHKL